MIVEHQGHGGHGVVVVEQGLAHAHQHHVGNEAIPFRVAPHRLVGPPELADDFRHRQVAVESLPPGRTEGALQGTPHLGGDAQGATLGFRDEYRLDPILRTDFQQPFARAVVGHLLLVQPRRPNLGHFGQLGAQRLGQIGHLGEVVGAVLMQPVHHLASAKRLLAEAFEESDESGKIEIEKVLHGVAGGEGRRMW